MSASVRANWSNEAVARFLTTSWALAGIGPLPASVTSLRMSLPSAAPQMSVALPWMSVFPVVRVPTLLPQLVSVRESTSELPPICSSPRTERAAGGSANTSCGLLIVTVIF